jgi:cyclophilin family peptidyl-prolyl cis-trans isomerase
MFKKDNLVWLYFVGILIMLVIVFLVGRDYIVPIVSGSRTSQIDTGFNYTRPPAFSLDTAKDYRSRINTNNGTLVVDLYESAAPNNVNNFVYLAQQKFYAGTYFHRLVPGLFIQGGDRNTLNDDPTDDGYGSPGYVVNDEVNWDALSFDAAKRTELNAAGYTSAAGLSSIGLKKYALAMASAGPNTNGSQFFFILAENEDPRLYQMSGKFTVIGEVILGREILNRIASSEVDATNQLVPRPIRKLIVQDVEIYTTN